MANPIDDLDADFDEPLPEPELSLPMTLAEEAEWEEWHRDFLAWELMQLIAQP